METSVLDVGGCQRRGSCLDCRLAVRTHFTGEAAGAPKCGGSFVYSILEEGAFERRHERLFGRKTKGHPLQYHVWLADRVYVSSEIPILGRSVELVVSFVPKVIKGGNVELTEPTISLGDWKLPVTYVLRYLQKHAPLPDEVAIDPEHTRVYVALTDIRFGNGYQVAAKKIDLAADEIVFTLTIPTKQHQ
ncbi:hypothetical protein GA8_16625 [Geobacillus sp. A8]|nr:hypothetical protein GA8_16625 [Geobacillus sp. A8]